MRRKSMDLGHFSDPSLLILSSLASGPKHGYAMMADILEFSGTQLEPGTLYGAISRLEERGWIEALPIQERRRPYQITAAGVSTLSEQVNAWNRVITTSQQRLALF